MKTYTNYYLIIFLLLGIYSCKAQHILAKKNLYTLKHYDRCLFYDDVINRLENIDVKMLNADCSVDYYNKKYFTDESKKLLLEVIKKRYSDEYIKMATQKRVLLRLKSRLKKVSEKLKDSVNFMYHGRFNKRAFVGANRIKKELVSIISSNQRDTIPKYKNDIDAVYTSLKKYKIDNSLIYSVAFMIEKDKAIPFLKGILKDTIHINTYAVKKSLAKLKIEPYYTEQLKELEKEVTYILENKDGNYDENLNIQKKAYLRVRFLNTKKAVLAYSKLLESKYFNTIDEGDYSIASIPIITLGDLLKLIENKGFKSYFKSSSHGYNCSRCVEKDVKWAIEWFKSNKDNIQLNKECR